MVYGEDAVRTVLAAEDRLVASDWPQVTSVLVGSNSLNLLSGQRHGSVKRALSEAFSERQIGRRVPRIAEVVQDYIARWAAGPQPTPGYAACQELSQAVFDVVVLGGDGRPGRAAQLQDITARLQAGFQTPPVDLPFTDYGKALGARREFGRLVDEAIARLRTPATALPTAGGAATTLDCALADVRTSAAAADVLSDSVVEDNMTAAFFGNASTGPSLTKALQNLAACPHVLERLRREQEDIVARHGTDITAPVLEEMSYGNVVAKELLRITPAVPAVFRVAIVDFELQGRKIPKGWRVWCHLGDSVLKYNNDTFEPDRWQSSPAHSQHRPQAPTDEAAAAAASPAAPQAAWPPAAAEGGCPVHARTTAKPPEYSLPFGSGVRTCLGRNLVVSELLVFLAVLARGYDWEAVAPGEEWRVVPAPAPKEGMQVHLRRRRLAA